jgi:hypothetical protein
MVFGIAQVTPPFRPAMERLPDAPAIAWGATRALTSPGSP